MATASAEATSVLSWFEFYTRLYENDTRVARPSHTLLQLLQAAFPLLYDEVVARRLMLGSDEWACVAVLLEAFYEVELGIDRSTLTDAMTFEDASLHSACVETLEYVVSALVQSDSKTRFVGDIMTMDDCVQVDIMAVIERVLNHTAGLAANRGSYEDDSEPPSRDLHLREASCDRHLLGTPTRSSSGQTSPSSTPTAGESGSPLHRATNAEMERLQRANDILKEDNIIIAKELQEIKDKLNHAEAEKSSLLETVQSIKLQAEMDILKKERTVRSYFDERVHSLQRELDRVTCELQEKTAIAKEVNDLRDEVDLLRPSADRLARAESTLAKYKTKIEDLASVNEKLRRTEEANADLLEKNLSLENQAAKATMLQRKLTESKEANTTIQFRVSELETKLSRVTAELEAKRVECESASAALLEAKALNNQLQNAVDQHIDAKGGFASSAPESVGGISELNPELMEKLARLEHENVTLRSQVDGTTSDRIDTLLDDIDDLKRIKKSFEKKYFDTCDMLKETEEKLSATEETVSSMRDELEKRVQDLRETTANRDSLSTTLEAAEQKIRELTDLASANKVEIARRDELEQRLLDDAERRREEILSLQLTLRQTVQQLQLSNGRNELLSEDVVAHQVEKQELVAYREQLLSKLQNLETMRSSLADRVVVLESEGDGLRQQLSDSNNRISTLRERENRFAMRSEELHGFLLKNEEVIDRQQSIISHMAERTEDLEKHLFELDVVRQRREAHIQLLTERLHMTEEDLAAVQTTKCSLLGDVERLTEQVCRVEEDLSRCRETATATIEDYEHQLLASHERKHAELAVAARVYEAELEKATSDRALLIAEHENEVERLSREKADSITRMTGIIDEKCSLLQQLKNETSAQRDTHKTEIKELRKQLQQEKADVESKRDAVASEFARYAATHSFSDEEVKSKEAAIQLKLSETSTALTEEKSKLTRQRDSLSDQVKRLHETNDEMNASFEKKESEFREALRSQLEANQKLVDVNHAIKEELSNKHTKIIQLESAVTRLESQVGMLERARNLYSPEDGIKREPGDSSTSYSSQLNSHVTQITEEMDLLRKENKKLREQLARGVVVSYEDREDNGQQSSKSYFLERIRQLELAKAQEEEKKRELLLVNAKLMQDQKQLQVRNAAESKDVQLLKEKVNTYMLRDERRKKEHEAFAQRVRNLEAENRLLRSSYQAEQSEPLAKLSSQSLLESQESTTPSEQTNDEDQENIPPAENLPSSNVVPKKRKFGSIGEQEEGPQDIVVHLKTPQSGRSNSRDADDPQPVDEVVAPAAAPPTPSAPPPRAKRRMTLLMSNRMASGKATTAPADDEKPSECQQQ